MNQQLVGRARAFRRRGSGVAIGLDDQSLPAQDSGSGCGTHHRLHERTAGGERYIPVSTSPERLLTEPIDSPSNAAAPPPHHRPGGGFQNPWPGFEEHGFGDFIRWRFGGGAKPAREPSPPRDSLPRRQPAIVRPHAARGYRSVTWIGHSTVLMQLGPLSVLRRFGASDVIERDWWGTVEADGFRAVCIPAQHFSGRRLGDRGDRLWCGWTIAADGVKVCFAGDTALHPEMQRIASREGPFDLVMLPIGAYDPRWFMRAVHMDPGDAIAAYRAL